ncbi:glycosyltransferase family 2 protein [Umezawaea beigongshangensis]|uniref:glycosyltransferase family 2 protein n=1 Tax=Umezawaea beigongshangensis TaxID=2780383 RepID=UPI0027DDC32F|nr:glycosyltransferase [Umezawaea beigongshangensis]
MSIVSTVVVVTWRGREHVTACLDALAAQRRPHEVIVLDNASDDGTAELIAAHPGTPRVLRLPRNAGYAGGLAAALPLVRTPYVAWLNDDAVPEPDWLGALEDALDGDPGAAAATSSVLLTDGSTQSVGVALTADGHGVDLLVAGRDVFGFCGGAALVRTAELAAAGGVPSGFFCYYEDTDTAWRLRLAGHRVISVGPARVRHRHGASTRPGSAPFHLWNERNRLLMLLRCAPVTVTLAQLARFALITAALPVRRLRGAAVPDAANFRLGLRLRVLAEVGLRSPAAVAQRWVIGRRSTVSRGAVWRAWAGRR